MPLMICPKCKKFHYVPGDCPAPKLGAGERSGAQAVHGFSGGDAVQLGVPAVSDKPAPNANRNADRHKPGYQAQKQREYRKRRAALRNGK